MDTDDLEQYDCVDDKHFEEAIEKYSPLIGRFMMNFSYLEHELNIAIADIINDRTHEIGYTIVEKITMGNKIELFHKLYSRIESITDDKTRNTLTTLRRDLEGINEFRNQIAHANWQTISKSGSVRVKIIIDNKEGYVKFKKVNIKPKDIRSKINEMDRLSVRLSEYTQK